jgi:hypothetical protein
MEATTYSEASNHLANPIDRAIQASDFAIHTASLVAAVVMS